MAEATQHRTTGVAMETEESRKAQLAANERNREARKEHEKNAEAEVKANAEQRERSNAEAMERMEKTKPTPTQEENDKAANGVHVESHEYDGSAPQGQTAEEAVASAKYYKQPEDSAHIGARRSTEEERKLHQKQSEGRPSGSQYQTRAATPKS